MFNQEEIVEELATEGGYFHTDAQRKGFVVDKDTWEVKAVNPHVYQQPKAEHRPSWPESERYPSARYSQLLGATKADRYKL